MALPQNGNGWVCPQVSLCLGTVELSPLECLATDSPKPFVFVLALALANYYHLVVFWNASFQKEN